MTELLDAEPEDPEQLLELVGVDPARALMVADDIVERRGRSHDPADVRRTVAAYRAAGLALRGLGRPADGEARVRKGLALAEREGLPEVAAAARMTLAFLLLELGKVRAALSATDMALASVRGVAAARVRATRALVLQRAGRPREAFAEYDAALKVLRRHGDQDWEARLLHNRALLSIEFGDTRAAIADLEQSRAYSLEHGQLVDATDALHNIGIATEVAGDIPRALTIFDQVEQEWTREGVDRPQLWFGRVDAYLSAGLVAEAVENARSAVLWLTDRHWEGLEAQARYTLAKCLLAQSDAELVEAQEQAEVARSMFAVQERRESHALAEYVLLKCRLRGRTTARDLDRASRVAEHLRETGCDAEAADLRSTAGRAALDAGDLRRAKVLLGPLTVLERSRTFDVRTRAWYARGLLARADGDVTTAHRTLRNAWNVVESQRALLGASELRAAAAAHASAMVETGAALATADGSAHEAFSWAERGRVAVLRYRPVVAPSDPELARALARLRWAARAAEDARLDGETDPADATAVRVSEAEVVRLTRRNAEAQERTSPVTASTIRGVLDPGDAFIELVAADGHIWAVCLTARRTTLTDLGPRGPIDDTARTLVFGLRRTLAGFGTGAGRAQAWTTAQDAAAHLDALLLSPLHPHIGDRSLVICPTADLSSVPWGMTPTARDRATRVAPSATVWWRARTAPTNDEDTVLAVAGPGLDGAGDEVRAIDNIHRRCSVLLGEKATVDAVLSRAPSSAVLHLAAHGTLRTDNPLFSTIELADGPLTGYDLESLDRMPRLVVLSACSSGAGRATVGEETLGLAWTVMGAGASTVVAPLLPIPDVATESLMTHLHRRLSTGSSCALALAEARASAHPDDSVAVGVASAFAAYGV